MSAILHPDKIPFSISDLTTTDIDSLTHILSQPLWVPNSDSSPLGTRQLWDRQKAISKLIQDLPFHLRRPIPSQTRIVSFISRKCNDDIPPACHLCDAHSRLNAQLIQTILSRIQIEVGERLNTFAKNMSKLSPEYKDLVCELRALHALWIPPDVYRKTYLSEPHTKWTFQPDECGACILARIGEDKHTLMLLRMTILARQKRRLPEPRLLRWVDGWIDWTGAAEEIRKESNEKEKELGKTRRVFHKRVKPSGFEKNVDEVPPKKKAGVEKEGRKESSSPLSEDYGFEEDIINGYQPSYSR
ncbi:MAG: hypothetical protein M1823_001105 [Watsoniomyces obsoletus]|nr:MAG: hypothetical protein M1823_001105 [Watsoniomyces obsoletus]